MNILKIYEAEKLLKKEGFSTAKSDIAKNVTEAKKIAKKIGYPIVLKNPKLLHKSEKNGVKVNVSEFNIEKKFKELRAKEVLVQKHINGVEFLIGIKKDDVFGHAIVFGIGGIYTELLNDVSMRIYPIKKRDAVKMMDEIKYNKIFNYRNKKLNKKHVIKNLLKLNKLIRKYPNIKELDINPLILNEKKGVIVDARIVLE